MSGDTRSRALDACNTPRALQLDPASIDLTQKSVLYVTDLPSWSTCIWHAFAAPKFGVQPKRLMWRIHSCRFAIHPLQYLAWRHAKKPTARCLVFPSLPPTARLCLWVRPCRRTLVLSVCRLLLVHCDMCFCAIVFWSAFLLARSGSHPIAASYRAGLKMCGFRGGFVMLRIGIKAARAANFSYTCAFAQAPDVVLSEPKPGVCHNDWRQWGASISRSVSKIRPATHLKPSNRCGWTWT